MSRVRARAHGLRAVSLRYWHPTRVGGIVPPNNSFKPNVLRYGNNTADRACHVVAYATHVGLIQALCAVGQCIVAARGRIPVSDRKAAQQVFSGRHCLTPAGFSSSTSLRVGARPGLCVAPDSIRPVKVWLPIGRGTGFGRRLIMAARWSGLRAVIACPSCYRLRIASTVRLRRLSRAA